MDFKLLVYLSELDYNSLSATTYQLDNNYIVGRGSSCGIKILSKFISVEHFTLILMPKSNLYEHLYYVIKDGVFGGKNSSRNGTWINGDRIAEITRLKHQDEITFGRAYPKAIFLESASDKSDPSSETFSSEHNS